MYEFPVMAFRSSVKYRVSRFFLFNGLNTPNCLMSSFIFRYLSSTVNILSIMNTIVDFHLECSGIETQLTRLYVPYIYSTLDHGLVIYFFFISLMTYA